AVANAGPAAATGVTVTDAIPGGVTLGAVAPSQGSCSGGAIVSCSLGALASGAQATVSITVTPGSVGPLTNAATVVASEADPHGDDNTASAVTTVAKAAPGLAAQPSAGTVLGGAVSASATLTGGVGATGAIAFRLYGPSDATCSGTPVFTSSAVVSG